MKLATILEAIRGNHRRATADDIRNVLGDYHNVLRWLADFLIGDEKLADAWIVDACTISQTHTPIFHEWLVYWAARATLRCAFQRQHGAIAELAPEYEKGEPVHLKHPPLSAEYFRLLIENSEDIYARLDLLCRFALVMRGIAKYSCAELATQFGISRSTVERAYCVAFDTLDLASYEVHRAAAGNKQHMLALVTRVLMHHRPPELKGKLQKLSPEAVKASKLADEPITAKLTAAPGNNAPIGGLKVVAASGWFAARPSGTEKIYKIYSESLEGQAHLNAILNEAQEIVNSA